MHFFIEKDGYTPPTLLQTKIERCDGECILINKNIISSFKLSDFPLSVEKSHFSNRTGHHLFLRIHKSHSCVLDILDCQTILQLDAHFLSIFQLPFSAFRTFHFSTEPEKSIRL